MLTQNRWQNVYDELYLQVEESRVETYQKTREKYEPTYTKEFNKSLFAPSDGGEFRRSNIEKFLSQVMEKIVIKNVLDI